MKKMIALLIASVLLICPVFTLNVFAAEDFTVTDGVLVSYNGKSAEVTIPSNVYSIADEAFKNNTAIKKLNLHSGVKYIGNEAFYGCTSLYQVNNSSGISAVGAYAFHGTPFLMYNSDNVVMLNNVAIGGNISGELNLPQGVGAIAPYAFAENAGITSFTAPSTLTEIGEGAFYSCVNLSEVSVGKSVSYIGALAFYNTGFLANAKSDFVMMGNNILVAYKGNSTTLTLPDTAKQVAGGAFYGNNFLGTLIIPEGVVSIGMRAFMNCTNLNSVSLPESLKLIDREAFARCKALTGITVPKSVELMGDSVFFGCTSLNTVNLLTTADVSDSMFKNCTSLEYVKVINGVQSIGRGAFENCSSLTDVAIPDSVSKIYSDTFKGAINVTVSCNEKSYVYSFCKGNSINSLQIGDSNYDGKVNIRDATYIQKHVASILKMSNKEILRADTNFDGKINVRDATYIQKLLAGMV